MPYRGSVKNKADKARWQRKWRKANPTVVRKMWDEWEARKQFDGNKGHRLRTFKLTGEGFKAIVEEQGGVCPICLEPPASNNPFVPDHDHACCSGRKSCGKCIRGLIHRTCNGAIGLLRDDPKILRRAVAYLEKSQCLGNQTHNAGGVILHLDTKRWAIKA